MNTTQVSDNPTSLMIAARNNNFSMVQHLVETYPGQLDKKDQNGWNALLHCCFSGSVEIFQYLVQNGMDTSTKSNLGHTILIIAAVNNNFNMVQHLVETYPGQLDKKYQDGWNALLYCCARGSDEIFQYLVQNGMDTTTKSNQGVTCLMIAARNTNFSIVQHLVETYPGQLDEKDQDGWNALLHCCSSGSVEIFQYLVQKGMDTTTKSNQGKTCLMIAARNNNFSMVQHLVKTHPGQLDEKDQNGRNALLHCCIGGSVKIFQYLVLNGMDTATKANQGVTCLMIAAANNNFRMVQHLVETYPGQLNEKDQDGWNALLYCCIGGCVKIFQYLVQNEMDTATKSHQGRTCLMIAADKNNFSMVQHLVEIYPGQLDEKDQDGWNALLYCCIGGCVKIFQYLVQNEMDTATKSHQGGTCLMTAAANNNFRMVQHLVETYPGQLNEKDQKGYNALLLSCLSGSVEIFQYLVQNGMDTATKANQGQTCLMIAAANNNFSMVQHLVETYPGQFDQKDKNGWNALLHCCVGGSVEIFRIIDTESLFKKDFSMLAKVVFCQHDALSMYIIEKYTEEVKAIRLWNPLPRVCVRGSLKVFNALISLGFDPNQADTKGRTCLMYAADGGHHVLVKRILNLSSVNIHATDDDGCTALHKCKSIDTSWEYLVKAGLSQEILNKKGRTPFQEVRKRSENIGKADERNILQLIAEGNFDLAAFTLRAYTGIALHEYLLLFDGVKEKYRHIRVVFLGPEGAGKTTLCKRLQREQVNLSQRCPTNGGNIYQQLFHVEIDTKRWLRIENEFTIRFGELLKAKQELKSNLPKEIIEEGPTCGKDLAPISKEDTRIAMASCTGNRTADDKAGVSTSKEKINTTVISSGKRKDEVKWNTDAEKTPTPKNEQINPLQREFSSEALASRFAADTSPKAFAFLSLWDMGGHFALQPSVHVFMSGHGVYIVTINMLQCLQDEYEVEKIRNWIRIVGTVSSNSTTNKHPPIIIVGTHMDLVREEYKDEMEREQKIKDLEKAICCFPEISNDKGRAKYSNLPFLKVDNSIEDDPNIVKLRETICDAAEHQDQWMTEIPANWISLERELLYYRSSYPVLTLEEVAILDADCEKPIEDKEEIKLFLQFLDCNRSVIYIKEYNTVITNPRWLLDALSIIITDAQFMPNEADILLKNDLQLYQEKGLLTNRLVQELFEKSDNGTYFKHLDIILKHFVWFGLIVKNVVSEHKFGHPDEGDAYIVPSKLKTLTNTKEIEYVIQTKARKVTKTLCYQFKGDLIPLETFDKIYAGILQEYEPLHLTSRPCPDNWCHKITYILLGILKYSEEKDIKSIYRNFGCFAANDSTNMIVSMHWEQSCIAITLFSHVDDDIPGIVARSIRQRIDYIVQKTLSVCKQDNIAYEYKLHCSYQLDNKDKPRDRAVILEIEGGVQCLGTKCGRKHTLYREDWLFWLSDLGDSSGQDSKSQLDIGMVHAKMINDLSSAYINPRLPKYWTPFQTLMEAYLDEADIYGTDVTGLSDICRTLMAKNIIHYGEYGALRSSVEGIHVQAATIIDEATSEIDKIKQQGQ